MKIDEYILPNDTSIGGGYIKAVRNEAFTVYLNYDVEDIDD